jgi:hypothetical protein
MIKENMFDSLDRLYTWFENWNCTWDGKTKTFKATREIPFESITIRYPSADVDWDSIKAFPDESQMDIEEFLLTAATFVEKAKYASGYLNDNKEYYIKEAEYWIKQAEKKLPTLMWSKRLKYYTEKYF